MSQSYTWYVQNNDPNTIQFCVQQSGGYANCVSIPGNSTQTFVIPSMDVQIYGSPTGYYVYYTSVGVKTGVKSLPSSGSTITVPPFTGCDPLLTQGQGYPSIVPCQYPGILFIKSESTPSMFVENYGAVPSGFQYGYGIAGGPLALATGPNWQYYRQYPSAKVYLIGNWTVDSSGNYIDQDSGRKYCGCQGATVYVIPSSALPGPSSTSTGTTSGGTTSQGTGTGTQTTTTQTTGVLNVANQCSSGVVVQAGGKTAYAPPYHAISLEVPIPTNYTLISQGQTVGQGTVSKSGEYVSPQTCPSVSPGPSPTPTPSPTGGGSTTQTQTTTTTTTSTGTQTTTTQTTGVLNVANQCSSGVVINAGGKTAYVPPYHAITLEVPIPTNYTLISDGQTIGQGTVTRSGEYVSPQTCPSSTPGPTPGPSPTGGTSTQTQPTTSVQIPWEILLVVVILGAMALSS